MSKQTRIDEAAVRRPNDIINTVWRFTEDTEIVVSLEFMNKIDSWVDGLGQSFVDRNPGFLCGHPVVVVERHEPSDEPLLGPLPDFNPRPFAVVVK